MFQILSSGTKSAATWASETARRLACQLSCPKLMPGIWTWKQNVTWLQALCSHANSWSRTGAGYGPENVHVQQSVVFYHSVLTQQNHASRFPASPAVIWFFQCRKMQSLQACVKRPTAPHILPGNGWGKCNTEVLSQHGNVFWQKINDSQPQAPFRNYT